jgi:PAS domain S-box-containing protein
MAENSYRPPVRALRNWPTLGAPASLALALTLFLGVFVLRERDLSALDADEILFVLPIAVVALRFGLRGAVPASLLALGLILTWDAFDTDAMLTIWGYTIRGVAFLLLGILLGTFVDQRRRLEAELMRHYDASLDMLGTADMDGRFTRVNAAWKRTLGHTEEEMLSRPFIEFVHPEDREKTIAETLALADGRHQTVGFRNRYRAADGSYRWLEWSAAASPEEGVIHAIARDVSAQHEAEEQVADNARWLETEVAERTKALEAARAETLQRLALAAEYRDDDTSQHTERVGSSAALIAGQLGLEAAEVALLREAAPLHDVGKLAISDSILLKPGRLTPEEFDEMKTHTLRGSRLLSGSSSPVLQMGAIIAASHHERWDGGGYPAGVRGEEIPLVGRIVAVADVFDALTHDRPYKAAWPVEQALAEIEAGAGSQFDPAVVAAFLVVREQVSPGELAPAPVSRAAAGQRARPRQAHARPPGRRGSSVGA